MPSSHGPSFPPVLRPLLPCKFGSSEVVVEPPVGRLARGQSILRIGAPSRWCSVGRGRCRRWSWRPAGSCRRGEDRARRRCRRLYVEAPARGRRRRRARAVGAGRVPPRGRSSPASSSRAGPGLGRPLALAHAAGFALGAHAAEPRRARRRRRGRAQPARRRAVDVLGDVAEYETTRSGRKSRRNAAEAPAHAGASPISRTTSSGSELPSRTRSSRPLQPRVPRPVRGAQGSRRQRRGSAGNLESGEERAASMDAKAHTGGKLHCKMGDGARAARAGRLGAAQGEVGGDEAPHRAQAR